MENQALNPWNTAVPPTAEAGFAVFPHVERCQKENSADKLEDSVKLAISVLDKLRTPLHQAKDNMDASRFLKAVEKLKSQHQVVRTLIGVVGNTGSGKSSVINAVLDEEMLVPTNCMRACTAVITELSYNYSENPLFTYRAEVEFISVDDWKAELKQLYADLIDSRGEVVKESSNAETEAGVAWAKIKAVYPQQTKEALTKTNPDALVNLPDLRAVLGSTRRIHDSKASNFYAKMQKFIDSQEKDGQKRKKGEKKPMQFWPLIKVVRIFTKADALSTGAVIVDLPGVHDSNAARAAVADKYMERCTGLWIVAPITRAVDDKTAQNLLGQSFKQQLKYDGMYSNVTFICSKTDDILITEAIQSLGLDEEIAAREIDIQLAESELAAKTLDLEEMIKRNQELEAKRREIQEQIDHLQELADALNEGTNPSTPIGSQKRKHPTRQTSGRKKTLFSLDIEEGSSSSETDGEDEAFTQEDITEDSSEEKPLSKDQIRSELERLRTEKAELELSSGKLEDQYHAVKKSYRRQKRELDLMQTGLKSVCIQGRNKYSKNAIRHDWARGIKEMDQEAAMLENDELFDPEHDIRDYDQIAASLPVFCVSSRAYQKKKQRLAKDDPIQGFCTEDETEVPQLQAHVKHLTEAGRASSSKQLLEEFSHILSSLDLWSKDHSAEVQLSDGEKRDQVDKLCAELSVLCQDMNSAADQTVKACHGILAKHIYDKFDASVEAAAERAVLTAEKWFEAKTSGGLPCNTFKATCRRAGAFEGKLGHRDLNEELIAPLKKALAHSWERVFTRRMPQALNKFPEVSKVLLEHFHQGVTDRNQSKTSFASRFSLGVQLRRHISDISTIVQSFQQLMTALHREANRELTPAVAKAMSEAYQASLEEIGNGCFGRMKVKVVVHVSATRYSMFREATESVRIKLNDICTRLQLELLNKIKDIIVEMTSEYQHVIIGTDLAEVSKIARDEISKILSETDALFQLPDISDEPIVLVKSEDAIDV